MYGYTDWLGKSFGKLIIYTHVGMIDSLIWTFISEKNAVIKVVPMTGHVLLVLEFVAHVSLINIDFDFMTA